MTADGLTTIPATQERFRFLETNEDLVRIDWWLLSSGAPLGMSTPSRSSA